MSTIFNIIKTKKLIFIILVVFVIFFLLRYFLLSPNSTDLVYKVTRENLVDSVQVSGTYETAAQTSVTSPTNGILDKIYVKNGDIVQRGAPLFHVESSATDAQKKSAYADYMTANSQLQADKSALYALQSSMYSAWKTYTDLATNTTYENADGSPNTTNRSLPQFTTVQDNWLAAEDNYKNQQNVIAKDQAALDSAQQNYAQTQSVTVNAPVTGTVENLLSTNGDQVTADNTSVVISANTAGQSAVSASVASPILVISNMANPYITADISEDYAASIEAGQRVSIVFDALKNKTFSGHVEAVNTIGTTVGGVVDYTARIYVNNLSSNIKPGMTALITIETLRIDHVLDVPNSALINKGSLYFVELAQTHKLVPVEIGTRGVSKTEIKNGLPVNTLILANPGVN